MKITAVIFAVLMVLVSKVSYGKDMANRLGLGIKNNTSESLPSLAVVHFFAADLAFTGGVGLDTKKDYSKFQLHTGVRKIIFMESNLGFYTGAQIGLVNYEEPIGGKQNGFELLAVFGTEFFFAGLENVGFTFEGGVGVASLKDVRFRTIADDPFRAGLVFYF